MIGSTRQVTVYAYSEPADLRRGFDGLSALVREAMGRDELSGDLYVFLSRDRRRDEESPEEAVQRLALRARLRQERSRALVETIRQWALSQRPLPRSGLGQAVHYLLALWPGLTRFLDDARIPLDNNPVERALRGVVVGRKNHYGSRSRRGCEVAALFYTLLETAKLCGVEPKSYLLQATSAALVRPGAVTLPQSLRV
jgi:transposase